MIRPPLIDGAAFSEATDGDIRSDHAARASLSGALGISDRWATVHQVHGAEVLRVGSPGHGGDADALWTTEQGLPVAVFTADCFGVVLFSADAVGVAHAGWRGADAGVVARLRSEMTGAGHRPLSAAIGPGIGSCCFEVGPEVIERFPEDTSTTTWDTASVSLDTAIARQLGGMDFWASGDCTFHGEGWFSHRETRTSRRLAAVAWVP